MTGTITHTASALNKISVTPSILSCIRRASIKGADPNTHPHGAKRMTRLRHRPDRFTYRGDVYFFHRIADGSTLGRLDPYSETAQTWPLNSGRILEVTGADVRDITFQVHGIDLPNSRPTGEWDDDRIRRIEARLDALEAGPAAFEARLAALEAAPTPEPAPPAVEQPAQLLPPPDTLLSDYGPVDPKDAETIIDGFAGELRTSRDTAEGTMRSMDPPDRRRLFSLLNDELGRLKNEEALLGKSIPRRADVEELIGILAQVGEA